jgi:predicted dehydrogenase
MGAWHARSLVRCREVALVGLCDLEGSVAEGLAAELLESAPELRVFTDMGAMLADLEPDLVTIATPNITHAALTLQAARYGVQAICCEKPMAVNLAEAREMHRVCRDAGTVLIVNHQRRTLPAMVRMREMIEEGAIGEVQLLRGTCQGDLLTDGTHVVDSLLHLSGDAEVDWVFGSVYRNPPPAGETPSGGFRAAGGYRYGHPIETGAAGIWQFAAGPRAEVFTGGLHLPGRQYNDYEVLGTTGRLWRSGDREHPGSRTITTPWRP